jgi:type VI secretion system protein ImpJ
MYWNSKVVWSEGMLLQQQHLQQQDRYWRNYVESRCARGPAGWGFSRLELDEHQLALGKLALLACAGIMPDGTPLSLPADDDLPLALDIPEDARDAVVVLALPLIRPGASETGPEGPDAEHVRYRPVECTVRDSNFAEAQEAVMHVGRLRARLALREDAAQGYVTLAVARVVERRADNTVVLDPSFCPPALDCRAAPRLARFMDELVGLLGQRGAALANRLTQPHSHGAAEIAEFLLLQLVNRTEPLFRHFSAIGGVHPECLYRELIQLAAELSCFTAGDKRPPVFAPYRHDDLDASFQPLMDHLRRALSSVLDPQAIAIALEEDRFGTRVGRIPEPALLRTASFVLAVSADLPPDALWAGLPAQLKVGPVEKIHDLVTLQLPGITVRPLPVAPRQLPFHAGRSYFALDATSDLWTELAVSAGIALHLAGDFPGLSLELWAIRQ